ncbi:shikimate kinase [Riemerella columbipharyngis]|uniref:Shikimate kinase n=2 Tax=Riemerella columbipharyngis TaxID=1071918 RepID=A0A1G7BMI5_9FLAO|nr:shikimate kinase [Riemerella columbipharyngis]
MGYMGSGKSHISKLLSQKINFQLFELDRCISEETGMEISEIFAQKGEIYFRKIEKKLLNHLIKQNTNAVLSLGGGTPAYYDNIDIINEFSESFFLSVSVKTLCERLWHERLHRPIISRINHEDLPEFVSKHLFERNPFYAKAKHIIFTEGKSQEDICNEIIRLLNLQNL